MTEYQIAQYRVCYFIAMHRRLGLNPILRTHWDPYMRNKAWKLQDDLNAAVKRLPR